MHWVHICTCFELQCIHTLSHTSLGQEWGKSVSAVQSENHSVKFEKEISGPYNPLGGDAL